MAELLPLTLSLVPVEQPWLGLGLTVGTLGHRGPEDCALTHLAAENCNMKGELFVWDAYNNTCLSLDYSNLFKVLHKFLQHIQ